ASARPGEILMAEPEASQPKPRRPWLALSSLGTRLVIFFVVLLVLVQGLGAFLVIQANSQIARQTIDQELEQGERVFRKLLSQNQTRLEQGVAILSSDFAFRQAIATNDTGTILSVLRNHGARLGANVMTLASLENVVRADTLEASRAGKTFAFPDLIKLAEAEGRASSVVIRDGKLYQLVVVPVHAPEPIAWVGLAFEVDDRVAKEMNDLTGLEVSFASRFGDDPWKLHASTLATDLRPSLLSALSGESGIAARIHDVYVGGDEYETRVTSLESRPETTIVAILQKPLEVGLAPFRKISSSFFWLTITGLTLLVAGSLVIARSITRPVYRLAEAANRIQQGD